MALACNPKVLIADEPTTALDVMVQAQILELLDALCRDFGLALILVTHDLPVVAQLCNRCAVMYAGEIVERGPLDGHLPRRRGIPTRGCCSPRRPISPGSTSRCSRFPARRRGSTGRSTAARSRRAATPSSTPAATRPRLEPLARGPRRRLPPQLDGCRRERRAGAARGRGPRRPLPDSARDRRVGHAPAAPQRARGRRRLAVGAAGRDARARRRVGLRQDDDGAGGAAAGRPRLRLDPLRRPRPRAARPARAASRSGAGSRSSTRIRTSRSTRASASARRSRSRS